MFIEQEKASFPITWMCRKLGVSRASYYRWSNPTGLTPTVTRRQQITYLFGLKDPVNYINVFDALNDPDKRLLFRYIDTCRNLAGYSVINGDDGLKISAKGGDPVVKADLPSHQEFSGFSTTFRQLHNDGEDASFVKAWKIVNRALIFLPLEEGLLAEAREDLKSWKQARHSLKGHMAATLICERLNPNLTDEHPRSLKGVVPEDLIKKFNYGDTLHWGDHRDELTELTDDPTHAKFYKFCCVTSMVSLSHVYFGFAELVEAALGRGRVTT